MIKVPTRSIIATKLSFVSRFHSDKWRDERERNELNGGWLIEVRGRPLVCGGVVDDTRWLVGWLEGAGKQRTRKGKGKGSSGYDEVCCVVHIVMRHVAASMMYRSLKVCVSSMMGGCSLDAGVRSRVRTRNEGAREYYHCFWEAESTPSKGGSRDWTKRSRKLELQ